MSQSGRGYHIWHPTREEVVYPKGFEYLDPRHKHKMSKSEQKKKAEEEKERRRVQAILKSSLNKLEGEKRRIKEEKRRLNREKQQKENKLAKQKERANSKTRESQIDNARLEKGNDFSKLLEWGKKYKI